MPLDFVSTAGAPKAIGPYSQGVIANGFLFTAGQVALDPDKGELVPGGITEQTTRALENLRAILKQAGSDFSQVVKTTVFLVDMWTCTTILPRPSWYPRHWRMPKQVTIHFHSNSVTLLPLGSR